MPTISLAGGAQVLTVAAGTTLLDALQDHGHPIATSCGGIATCAMCRVTVQTGREHLSPINSREVGHLGTVAKIVGLRLACQARLTGTGDVVIDVPETEDVAAKKQAKAARLRVQRGDARRR